MAAVMQVAEVQSVSDRTGAELGTRWDDERWALLTDLVRWPGEVEDFRLLLSTAGLAMELEEQGRKTQDSGSKLALEPEGCPGIHQQP